VKAVIESCSIGRDGLEFLISLLIDQTPKMATAAALYRLSKGAMGDLVLLVGH
jgi:hypothetical protein